MRTLTVTEHNGVFVVDSREVAEMVEKRHADLLRDIDGYRTIIDQNANLRSDDFFLLGNYNAGTGKNYKLYYLTRKGCDMVANKMTGHKGVWFTAEYVTRFLEMENKLQPQSLEDLIIMQATAMKQLRGQVQNVTVATQTLAHRVDNLDLTNIEGTPRQRLNAMIRKYANQQGITYQTAWQEFTRAYNTAYRTNLKQRKTHEETVTLKKHTMPEFLEVIGEIEDAIRVADKMLNQAS